MSSSQYESYWKTLPEDALIGRAGVIGDAATQALVVTLLQLRDALVTQQEATNSLTERIWWLNFGLLWLAVISTIRVVAQVLVALEVIHR